MASRTFGERLKQLMDGVPNLSRQDWADALGIATGQLSHWFSDSDLPRHDKLYSIVCMIREIKNVDEEVLRAFAEIIEEPGWKVTEQAKPPNSMGAYMLTDLRESFLSVIDTLPTRVPEMVYLDGKQM